MMFDYAKSSKLYDTLHEYYGVLKLCRLTRKNKVLEVGCGLVRSARVKSLIQVTDLIDGG